MLAKGAGQGLWRRQHSYEDLKGERVCKAVTWKQSRMAWEAGERQAHRGGGHQYRSFRALPIVVKMLDDLRSSLTRSQGHCLLF